MSKDPTRLIDDAQRVAGLRDGLRSAAATLHPDCDVVGGAMRLDAAIRSGAIPPEPPVPAPIMLARLSSPSGLALGVGLVGIASLLIVPLRAHSHRAESPAYIARDPATTTAPLVVVAAPELPVPLIDRVHARLPDLEPPAIEPIVNPQGQTHLAAHAIAPQAPAMPAWRAEMLQLELARQSLRGDPAAALNLARAGQRAFPSGLYGEERDAIEIQALNALRRPDEVRSHAERFLARHPHGPFSERVRALLPATGGGSSEGHH